jgi:hypothetical protein
MAVESSTIKIFIYEAPNGDFGDSVV